ncbi:MAG TPA: hypothetical protein VI299_25070 [Polyangiales bacterium]
MKDVLLAYHLDAALGILLLLYLAYGALSERRWRRAAVRVRAAVVAVYPYRAATSYFFRCVWEGRERGARYNGPPLRTRWSVGDEVEILIEPNGSDVSIPTSRPNDAAARVGEGNCRPIESHVITFPDLVFGVVGAVLICVSVFRR